MKNNRIRDIRTKKAAVTAVAVFLAVWILALIAGVNWSSSDDPVISLLVTQSRDNISIFQQKWLLYLLHSLSMMNCSVNFWLILNVLCIAAGISACCYIAEKRTPGIFSAVFAVFLTAAGYIFALRKISYTCTSVILSCGGMFLTADALFPQKAGRKLRGEYSTGIIFLLVSFAIRKEAGYIGLGYLAAVGLLCMDFREKFSVKAFLTDNIREIALLCLSGLLCLMSVAINNACLTPEEKEYIAYNDACTRVRDYASLYPSWDQEPELYTQIGISENDYDLLFNRWVFDDPEVFSTEKLEKIGQLKYAGMRAGDFLRMPAGALRRLIPDGYFWVLMFCIIAITISVWRKKRKYRIKIAPLWGLWLAYFLYIVYNGRIVDHVIFSILWGLCCSLALMKCMDPDAKDQPSGTWEEKKRVYFLPGLMILLTVLSSVGVRLGGYALFTPGKDYGTSENENRVFYDTLSDEPDSTFIFAPNLYRHVSLAYGPWNAFPEKYCENVFYLGGWQARTGYCTGKLSERKIENPMKALAGADPIYSLLDENTGNIVTFLREHYDPLASCSIVREIGDCQIIRFCGAINAPETTAGSSEKERHTVSCSTLTGSAVLFLEGELEGTEEPEDVYCSVNVGSNTYFYALNYDSGKFNGRLIISDGSGKEPDTESVKIIIKNAAGEYRTV